MNRCSLCGKEAPGAVCAACGFDESRNYEKYPTLQMPETLPRAVSALRHSGQTPSVEDALLALQAQGWEGAVLSAVRELLRSATEAQPEDDLRRAALLTDLVCVLRQRLNSMLLGCIRVGLKKK